MFCLCYSCKRKCFSKISEEDKSVLLQNFNRMNSKSTQDVYLQGLIVPTKVIRRRPRANPGNPGSRRDPREASYHYLIKLGPSQTVVCRHTFCSLHGITVGRVKHVARVTAAGAVCLDGRGKHNNRKTYSLELLKQMDDHIRSFPVRTSHYRSRTVQYLSCDLTVTRMHYLFLKSHYPCCATEIDNGHKKDKVSCECKYFVYRKYFNENFGYGFGKPKSDVCNECCEIKAKLDCETCEDKIETLKRDLLVHKCRAKAFHEKLRVAKEIAKTDETVETLTFDFMQHVPVPKLPVNEIFYLRQMWVYTFGIHQHSTEKPYFFMWSEADAKHGVNEVISCLLHFIENHVPRTRTVLNLFSDACTGQNRNSTMIHFLTALVNSGRFKRITHDFPVRGHSFLPCDSDFSHLGKIKNRQENVYTPTQWVDIFKDKHHVTPFADIRFFDFTAHFRSFFKKTVIAKGEKFLVTKYKRFKYTRGKSTILVSESLKADIWSEFCLLRPRVKVTDVTLPQNSIYTSSSTVPLKQAKINDLKKLYKYLNPDQVLFYDSLQALVDEGASDTDADEG